MPTITPVLRPEKLEQSLSADEQAWVCELYVVE